MLKSIRKTTLALLVFLVMSACSTEDANMPPTYIQPVEIGLPAPDFLFKDMQGAAFRLSENRDKVVLIFFWRLKCEECTQQMDSLEALHKQYKDTGLEVVAVSAESIYSASLYNLTEFLKARALTFRVLRDEQGFVSEAFQVIKAPAAYIIGKDGVLRAIKQGPQDWQSEENLALIQGLLNG
ncbi:MAG: TlpA family protein disulfide reductase [Deltaproteobacteria bacterium]|nr:TlpA family protein disulfide reductase [Deltaproteobacteria bacterium]